jgi:hypothetical protein
MRQKWRLLVPAIALLLSLFPLTSAEAAVTAGASCKKSGQIIVVKGIQFKCVKKGKKLTWSKFTQSTKATPTPTPSATPVPTPSASPSATANPLKRPDVPSQALVVQTLLDEV